MDVVAAYRDVGTYRGAAAMCGVDPKTVKRKVLAHEAGELDEERAARAPVAKNTDGVRDVVAERVAETRARVSAKRLLPAARAAGYTGSPRNFRRLVAEREEGVAGGERPSSAAPGGVGAGRDGGDRLGHAAGRGQGVLRGVGVVPVPVRALRP